MRFPLKRRESFYNLKNHFKNDLESPLIVVYFKRENKIRNKKTLNVTLTKKMRVREKSSLGSGVKLLIGKVRWQAGHPSKLLKVRSLIIKL